MEPLEPVFADIAQAAACPAFTECWERKLTAMRFQPLIVTISMVSFVSSFSLKCRLANS
jgi:hypothetical protein